MKLCACCFKKKLNILNEWIDVTQKEIKDIVGETFEASICPECAQEITNSTRGPMYF